jgi:hypothetical protein
VSSLLLLLLLLLSQSAKVLMNLGQVREGNVVRRTAPIALLFVLLSQLLGLIFTLGGVWPDAPFPNSS